MDDLILVLLGYIIGIIVSWLIFRPMKSFNAGIELAKKTYGDWEKGFDTGWDAAFKHMETIARAWNERERGESDEQENAEAVSRIGR